MECRFGAEFHFTATISSLRRFDAHDPGTRCACRQAKPRFEDLMQQETQPRRNSFRTLLPLAAGALAMGAALVACDRPMQQADSSREERREAAAPEQRYAPPPAAPREAPERPAALPPRDALTDTVISGK